MDPFFNFQEFAAKLSLFDSYSHSTFANVPEGYTNTVQMYMIVRRGRGKPIQFMFAYLNAEISGIKKAANTKLGIGVHCFFESERRVF